MLKQLSLVALLALGACGAPPIPDSGAGVGFGDYEEYERAKERRDAQLRGESGGGGGIATMPAGQMSSSPASGGSGGFYGDAILAGTPDEDDGSDADNEFEDGSVSSDDLAAAGIGGASSQ